MLVGLDKDVIGRGRVDATESDHDVATAPRLPTSPYKVTSLLSIAPGTIADKMTTIVVTSQFPSLRDSGYGPLPALLRHMHAGRFCHLRGKSARAVSLVL